MLRLLQHVLQHRFHARRHQYLRVVVRVPVVLYALLAQQVADGLVMQSSDSGTSPTCHAVLQEGYVTAMGISGQKGLILQLHIFLSKNGKKVDKKAIAVTYTFFFAIGLKLKVKLKVKGLSRTLQLHTPPVVRHRSEENVKIDNNR